MKVESVNPDVQSIAVLHDLGPSALFLPGDAPPSERTMELAYLTTHTVRLSTQAIRIAYDPVNDTLYVGEFRDHGLVERSALMALEQGRRNPFFATILDAADAREYARAEQRRTQERYDHHARVVADATERLKSRKPGVRRRAKRLLEKLGR